MASTDLSSSRKPHVHTPVSLRQPLRCGLSILICSCLFAGAAQCRARVPQDVAEAARQERARKDQQKKSKHVYTDDDLRRAKILTPDDQARVEAARKIQPPPTEEQAQLPASADEIAQLPLGDIARRYRNAKQATQAPDPFHLPFDEPVFADPVISLPELTPPRPTFTPAHPSLAPAHSSVPVAPAISSPTPSQHVDALVAQPKPARPASAFSPTHPILLPAHPDATVAPALPGHAPSSSFDPSISLPKVARARTSFSPAQPNLSPARPSAIVAPTVSNPAPLHRVDPFTRRFAPAAPPSAARVAPQPKTAAAIALSPPEPNVAKTNSPIAAQPKVPPAVAPSTMTKTSSSSLHVVTVQPGDSLWKLAQQNLGRGSRWQELLAANPSVVDPTRIAAGSEIVIPAKATGLKSDLKVTVQQGDTLSKIAQLTYGRAAAWRCIAQANAEITDANRIYKGQQLLLPFNCQQ